MSFLGAVLASEAEQLRATVIAAVLPPESLYVINASRSVGGSIGVRPHSNLVQLFP